MCSSLIRSARLLCGFAIIQINVSDARGFPPSSGANHLISKCIEFVVHDLHDYLHITTSEYNAISLVELVNSRFNFHDYNYAK